MGNHIHQRTDNIIADGIDDISQNHNDSEQEIDAQDGKHNGAPVLYYFLTQGSREAAPIEYLIDGIHSSDHFEAVNNWLIATGFWSVALKSISRSTAVSSPGCAGTAPKEPMGL